VLIPADFAAARFMTGDVENDGDDAEAQDAEAQADQSPDEERRPRRRGRRGGRRRRGSTGTGLAGSISDELGPTSASEVVEAVADFDSAPIAPEPEPQAGSPDVEAQPKNSAVQPDIASPPDDAKDQAISETEKTVRRRSTVREKVSFTSEEAPPVAPAAQSQPEETAPEPQQPPDESNEDRPRRAGWWSRRFGNGG
jgi:ribonuclease E